MAAEGYCIIRDLVPTDNIAALDRQVMERFTATPYCQGDFYGTRTKRFGRLLLQAPATAALVQHPLIVAIAEQLLGDYCDRIQLNLTQAIEIHPLEIAQAPHRDQDMWAGEKGRMEYLLNVMWPLTPFREENGATQIWPRSHGPAALDPSPVTPAIAAECEPGDAILFLGSTLHCGGANRTARPRRSIVTGYSLGWLKTYENQFLAYPPNIARGFGEALSDLVGYRQHRPNLGNFEGQCPSRLLGPDAPEHLAAIDALRPDQAMMVGAHAAQQRTASHGHPSSS
ncbi:ectoine hydroxylase-related dioxygenase (phytanoyl-CoA dioxygenase family) [Sphingomonas zeicaulis]|uniref:phytanoyl-CoA dioxygenase family protein n=1 Tax=Sphingomonas zeicaulis TaxID=1632740 RepID=UPI003D21EC2F